MPVPDHIAAAEAHIAREAVKRRLKVPDNRALTIWTSILTSIATVVVLRLADGLL